MQLEIRRVTRIVTVLSVAMGLSFFFLGHVIGRTFWENFIFAIGILVANVPEGLLPTVTLAPLHGQPADGATQCPGEGSPRGRGPGIDDGDLHTDKTGTSPKTAWRCAPSSPEDSSFNGQPIRLGKRILPLAHLSLV